jgi:hypothetical protein
MGRPARLPGHDELPAGQLLGEPDLACVHAPGHGHDDAGEPRRPQPEQGGDRGMTGTGCYGCEHVVSLIGHPIVSAVPRCYSNI